MLISVAFSQHNRACVIARAMKTLTHHALLPEIGTWASQRHDPLLGHVIILGGASVPGSYHGGLSSRAYGLLIPENCSLCVHKAARELQTEIILLFTPCRTPAFGPLGIFSSRGTEMAATRVSE